MSTMTERLTWTKLDDGDLLCHQHPIRLAKPMDRRADSPGWMILVPTEEEADAADGDGWWWRSVSTPGETWPLEAKTQRDARDLVVEQLPRVLHWISEAEYPGWTTERFDLVVAHAARREAGARARQAESEAIFEAGRPAREAAARAAQPRQPSPAQVRNMLTEALDLLERARPDAISDLGRQSWLQRRDALREKAKPITD